MNVYVAFLGMVRAPSALSVINMDRALSHCSQAGIGRWECMGKLVRVTETHTVLPCMMQ